jgi:non-specific serine/threonine protein kinase
MDTASPSPAQAEQATFGWLLRRHRLAAGLTQEALAERAGLSVKGLSLLESGKRQVPYRHTVALLARALGLTASETATLDAAVVRARTPAGASASMAQGEDVATGQSVLQFLATPPDRRSNLPAQLTSFIGRAREQAEVVSLLGRARLVTLTGAGGSGKTRLALMVAGTVLADYPYGVWLVELAALADPALVPQTVAQVLGLREQPDRTPLEMLLSYLQYRCALLVLDNCEHLVGACAELATALLLGCPQLRLLATSREALEVAGEALYRVPSLRVPDLDHLPPLDRLAQYEAVQLFVERAQARRADFALGRSNGVAVAQVCIRLDGMPLAIELAAARIDTVPVQTIATRLDDRFRLLTGGPRTALPRQQTLRATLDWSHGLLSPSEQVLLRCLAVFAGGWALEAAEAVCAGEIVAKEEILDLLSALVHKSMVQAEEVDGGPRYRLLETVRQYGQERLAAAGEEAAVQDAHLAYFLALAEQADSGFWGSEEVYWMDRLEAEHDNLRAALRWSLQAGDDTGMRLAGALGRFWMLRGYPREGRTWLEAVQARNSSAAPAVRAVALGWVAQLAHMLGDHEQATTAWEASLPLAREAGDNQEVAWSLMSLGRLAHQQGDLERARALTEEGLALHRAINFPYGIACGLWFLAEVALTAGDYRQAAALLEEALSLMRLLREPYGIATLLLSLGQLALDQGDYARAAALCTESLEFNQRARSPVRGAQVLAHLGLAVLALGEWERAGTLLRQALTLHWEVGYTVYMAACVEGLAALAGAQGRWQEAAQLLGSAAIVREGNGFPLRRGERATRDRTEAAAQAALGEAAYAAIWAEGQALPLDEVVALALGHNQPAER